MQTLPRAHAVSDGLDALFDGLQPTLTAPEVAELLGMTKQGVYNWLRDGVIPGYKLGSTWFVLRDDLKEAMRHGANVPKPGAPGRSAESSQEG